eukprot:10366815-Alexandrium_andersonii.AAC.1
MSASLVGSEMCIRDSASARDKIANHVLARARGALTKAQLGRPRAQEGAAWRAYRQRCLNCRQCA